jgi:hypothetical protein
MDRKCLAGVAFVISGWAMVLGSQPCYFIQRDGCGTGSSFCTNGQTVCDVGYSKKLDTGCGRLQPFNVEPVDRRCYTLTSALTHPCDQPPPGGGYTQIGCALNGMCCYGVLQDPGEPIGTMTEPVGNACCDVKAES